MPYDNPYAYDPYVTPYEPSGRKPDPSAEVVGFDPEMLRYTLHNQLGESQVATPRGPLYGEGGERYLQDRNAAINEWQAGQHTRSAPREMSRAEKIQLLKQRLEKLQGK